MNVRVARGAAWSAVGLASVLVVAGAVVLAWAGPAAPGAPDMLGEPPGVAFTLMAGLLVLLFGGAGTAIVSRFPSNLLGWTFVAGALTVSMLLLGGAYGYAGLVVRPGELPGARVVQLLLGEVLWLPLISIQVVALLVLFPDGRPASRGRRLIFLFGLAGTAIGSVGVAVSPTLYAIELPNPLAVGSGSLSDALGVGFLVVIGAGVAAAVSLIGRFRRSRGDERQQMKWFVYAAALMFVVQIPMSVLEEPPVALQALSAITIALLPVAVGVAILKYRLYDIDLVINKTLVYAILAGFITVVFLTLVVGVSTVVGGGSTFLAAVAAAVVALVFQPVRRWAQHLANRLVYGERATPYEVLSGFSERLAETYSIEDVLPRTARVLAEGLGADGVAIVLREDDRRETIARWPADAGARRQDTRSFEVRHQGALLGEIEVAMSPGEPLDAAREKLVRDVAAQAGLVLRNVTLIGDLRASRARLVAAQSEERRRIERNIHDGAQQQLVALAVKLRLADSLVGGDEARMHELLAELQRETNDALEDLRDLARGIYPPVLADRGLGAALETQARRSLVPVSVEADGIGRYLQEAEAAVYFSCLEALQNVAKYAQASHVTIRLAQTNGVLTFEVTDDGVGFDPATVERGSGLQGIADRLAALGGALEIRSAPGDGTTLVGRVPVEVGR